MCFLVYIICGTAFAASVISCGSVSVFEGSRWIASRSVIDGEALTGQRNKDVDFN